MKAVYKVFGAVTDIVTWSILLAAAFAIVALFLPRVFSTRPYIVLSGSMEPVIPTGSLAYIHKSDEPLQEGDIVGYMAGEGLPVVHRIVGRGEEGWITQGDANEIRDMNEVTDGQVLGKLSLTVPKAGYLLAGIRSRTFNFGHFSVPVLIPAVAGILLLLYIIQYLLGLLVPDYRNKKEKEKEND